MTPRQGVRLGHDMAKYLVCLLSTLLIAGCGSGATTTVAPAAPAPPPPVAPKPVAVVEAKKAPAKVAAPVGDEDQGPRKPAAIVNQFPEENIHDVFVTSPPAPMTTAPAPPVSPQDQFAVTYGDASYSSNTFQAVSGSTVTATAPANAVILPEGFRAEPQFGYRSDGYPNRIICDQDGKLMAFIPGGSVRVGSNDGPAESQPQFVTFHDPFYMDVTEVTLAQFELYRQSQRDQKKRVPQAPLNASQPGNYPALGLAWGDASTYVRWAGKELPTEAEFEKAARGPDGYLHPWGNGRPVWPRPRTSATITAGGQYPGDLGPFGQYDLAGNAREWMADWYSPQAHQEAAKLASQRTLNNWSGPKKAAQGSQRVIKGAGPNWEAYYRSAADMHERLPDVGFRGVLRLKPETSSTTGS